MLDNVRDLVYRRRKGLATAVGFAGAFYLAAQYVMGRLEEIREQVVQEKTARENLRRRFQQNQQDCTYTILALVPTLGDKILEEMDVESITLKLQMQSKAAKSRMPTLSSSSDVNTSTLSLDTNQPSITSSMELSMPSPARIGLNSSESSYSHAESAQSWVEQFTSNDSSSVPSEIDHHSQHDEPLIPGSPTSSSGAHLSDSVTSASLASATDSENVSQLIESLHSGRSEYAEAHSHAPTEDTPLTNKTKAELWREVKILTFTRTLTILYSTTLLSLLTHVQLNLLGRYKYVRSVLEMEREQKLKERQTFQANLANLFWNAADIQGASNFSIDEEINSTLGLFGAGQAGYTERKYLTLSWWLLNVGWKEVGNRVRVAVEAVLDEVSLKAKLGMEDLERLIKDIRQMVEFSHPQQTLSNTPQDASALSPRRISFLSSLIPVRPENLKEVLEKGGLPPQLTDIEDTAFLQLVEDTRDFISSADFGQVLESCLNHATDILFDGLRRMVFPDGVSNEEGPGPSNSDKIRLAGMLPGVARWSHAAIHGTPNELVEGLAEVRGLAGFSAIIYSSYAATFR